MEYLGAVSVLPTLLVFVLAILSRRPIESLAIGALVGLGIVHGTGFISGFAETSLRVLSDRDVAWVILACGFMGSLIGLLIRTGATREAMHRTLPRMASAIFAALPMGACSTPPEPGVDTIFLQARAYTLNDAQPWAEAIAVHGGRIVYVGDDAGALALAGPRTVRHDLAGRMLLPGLIDAHMHLIAGGGYALALSLDSFGSIEDWVQAIGDYARENPDAPVLFGYGFLASSFGPSGPTRQMIDAVVADRPVLMMDEGFHGAWANTRALERLGITRDTPDPDPGFSTYERDAAGEPTGYLLEGTAETAMEALNAIEAARHAHPASASRYAICHIQVITDEDLPRCAELGVIAQSTPLWASYDVHGRQFVSQDQFERFWRFNSLAKLGTRLTFGSDFPASGAGMLGLSPIVQIEIGHTRQEAGDPSAPVQPRDSERLAIAALIRGYTLDAAYQLHMEDEIGSLEVGKRADLVVLERNLFETPTYEIHQTPVAMTLLDGEVVYRADADPESGM